MAKRILRTLVKIIAAAAGLIFVFDNDFGGRAGIWLLASIGVLFVCMLLWLIFDLGEHEGYWPDRPV